MQPIQTPNFLVANVVITPDGTKLISHSRLDKVYHTDTITNRSYYVSGGLEKFNHSEYGDEIAVQIYSDSPFSSIREYLTRGTNENNKLKWYALKNMNNPWIEKTIKYIEGSFKEYLDAQLRNGLIEKEDYDASIATGLSSESKWYIDQFKKELVYRQLKKIFIPE